MFLKAHFIKFSKRCLAVTPKGIITAGLLRFPSSPYFIPSRPPQPPIPVVTRAPLLCWAPGDPGGQPSVGPGPPHGTGCKVKVLGEDC